MRVPSHLPVSVLQDSTIDLRHPGVVSCLLQFYSVVSCRALPCQPGCAVWCDHLPGVLAHGGRQYQPVVRVGAGATAVVLPGGQGGHKVRGCVC